MDSELTKGKPRELLCFILFLQVIVIVTVLFDVPVARQVIGFIYFTFVPGFLIVKLLKLHEVDWTETLLFSVGLSIAFLMLSGLFTNELFSLFGVTQPLSLMPLIITLNSLILIGGVAVCLRSEDVRLFSSGPSRVSPFVLFLLCLPILSILGTLWVNAYGNNTILLFMIIAISSLFIIGFLSKKLLPSKLYPFVVFMIAIAILYHSSLISNYIACFGSDVPGEYFVFKSVDNRAYWSSTPPSFWGSGLSRLNAMLSITILPTVYSTLLEIDTIWMFKLLYPLIFAFVPLCLYKIWQTYVAKKYAFVAAFLFMAQSTFYGEMLGLNRQIIAELFFVLLLLVMVNKKMRPVSKMMFFMVFSFALVTSHYGLAEIFFFFILSALVFQIALKRPSRNTTMSMVVFFFVVMFAWYIYTSGSATFDSFLEFGDHVYRQLGDFLDPAARGETVLTGMGMTESPSIWNTISRVFAYLTQALVVVGFVGLVVRRSVSRYGTEYHFEDQFFVFSSIAMALLAALILVPGLAETMNMTRFYHILLFFLAPLCVLGAETLTQLVSKPKKTLLASILLVIVLVPYFLFQTGFVYEVTGTDSWSMSLSGYRWSALQLYGDFGYADARSVYGVEWVSSNINVGKTTLYADSPSRVYLLRVYGMISGGSPLSNSTVVADGGVVYLSTLNVVEGVILYGQLSWNLSELSFVFDCLNTVYANGGSEVYTNRP